jgi:hypothetical protein
METTLIQPVPVLNGLPVTLPREGAVDIELDQGALIFRVSQTAQERIENLLLKQRESGLTSDEEQELNQYEEVDDYLSYLNRLIRNLVQAQQESLLHAS